MKTVRTRRGTFESYDTGTITRALEAGQDWDAHVGRALQEAEPGGWALDLGAHLGWFTCQLAQYHEYVIAVEPFPTTFQLLTRNLRLYHGGLLERVQCWPVAAYSWTTVLGYDAADPTDMGANCYLPAVGSHLYVPAVPLDAYLPPAAPVRVIKADCQGADLHALLGLTATIRRCRPLIIFEWEEALAARHLHTWADYLAWAAALDYTVERITTDFWDYIARPREGAAT